MNKFFLTAAALAILSVVSIVNAAEVTNPIPLSVMVPKLHAPTTGQIFFQWSTSGDYTFYTAPRDWEQGIISFQMLRNALTATDTLWNGGNVVKLPQDVKCVRIRAYYYPVPGQSPETLWEFKGGVSDFELNEISGMC